MAQGNQFPLRKPPGFHHDFFILGITTFIAGLLGIPAPNGLIPQAPIHTTSLLVMDSPQKDIDSDLGRSSQEKGSVVEKTDVAPVRSQLSAICTTHSKEELEPDPTEARDGEGGARRHEVPIAVVEQRVSNLAQGALCLVLLSGPFQHVLGLIPRGVLAGLL